MTVFETTRDRGRRAIAALLAVWLTVAMQPCAMAMDTAEDHDCPHCPPAPTEQHHGNHNQRGHHASHTESDQKPCMTASDDCSLADELQTDGRFAKLELKDAPDDTPQVSVVDFTSSVCERPLKRLGWDPSRSPPPDDGPSLNILYCVFLD